MSRRIMIIEDNETTREILASAVEDVCPDADIRKFADTKGAVETAINSRIDLFLVDIITNTNVPGDTSGIRFVEAVRRINEYEFTPVIFITSLEDPAMYAYAQLHSFSYIEKPFDTDCVKDAIAKALRMPQAHINDRQMFFRSDGILFPVKCSEIIYIENIDHKAHFHKVTGEELIIPKKTCRQILEEADNDALIQCNRGVIINRNYIEHIDLTNRCIRMRGIDAGIVIGVTFVKKISGMIKDGY